MDNLASLVFQLKVGVHMWLALHAYRQSPAGAEMMHTVVMHVEAAYNVLGGLFPRKPIMEASPKGKQAGASSGTWPRSYAQVLIWGPRIPKRKGGGGCRKVATSQRCIGRFGWCMSCVVDGLPA